MLEKSTHYLMSATDAVPTVPNTLKASAGGPHIAYVLTFLALFCWFLLFFYPGGMSPDSVAQLTQARAGVFSDSHPPIMAFVWHYVDLLTPGPFGMLLLQSLCLLFGITAIFYCTAVERVRANVVLIAATVLYPPTFALLGVVWKDIAMASAYLSSLGLFLVARQAVRPLRIALLAISVALILYGVATRYNAAPAALPLLVLYAYELLPQFRLRRRVLMAIGAGIVGLAAIFVVVQGISSRVVAAKSNFWQVGALYDITGVSFREHKNLFPPGLYPSLDLSIIQRFYTPRSLLPLTVESKAFPNLSNPVELARLRQAWIGTVRAHPGDYLSHRWAVFRELIGFTWQEPWVAVYRQGVVPNNLGVADTQSPVRTFVFAGLNSIARGAILYRPYLYMLLSVVMLGLLLWLRFPEGLLAGVFLASGLLHMIALFFVTGSPDFRYAHWMILCTVLAAMLVARDVAARSGTHAPSGLTSAPSQRGERSAAMVATARSVPRSPVSGRRGRRKG